MSKTSTEEITLVILGDGTDGVRAIKATREEIEKLDGSQKKGGTQARKYGEDHKKAEKDVGGFADTVKKGALAVVAAGTAAAGAVAAIFKSRATAVEAIVNTTQMLDVSTQSFMGQAHAASFLGIETQKYGDILRETTKRVAEFHTKGSGSAAEFFKAMNLDVAEFAALKPDELMRRIGHELKDLNQNQRIMFLDQLGGAEAVLLGNIIGDLDRLEQEAVAIGVALSDVDAQILADSVTAMTQVGAVATGAGNQISVALAPIVTDLAGRFYQAAVDAGGIGNAMEWVVNGTVKGIGFVLNRFESVMQLLSLARIGFLELGAGAADALASIAEPAATVVNFVVQVFSKLFSWWNDKVASIFEFMSRIGGPLGKTFEDVALGIRKAIEVADGLEVTAEDIHGVSDATRALLVQARADYDELVSRPPASERLEGWLDGVRIAATDMAEAQVEANQSLDQTAPLLTVVIDKNQQLIETMQFENSLMRMNSLERAIETNLRKLDADATDEQRAAVRRLTIDRHVHEEALKQEAERTKLLGEAQKNQIQGVQKAYSDLIYGFIDAGKLRFQDFFDFIVDGWKRTYAEFASKNIATAMFGSGSGGGVLGGGSGGAAGVISSLSALFGLQNIPGLISGGTDFIGRLLGYSGSELVGPTQTGGPLRAGLSERLPQGMDILKSLGFTIAGGFAGNSLGESLFGKEAESQIAATIGGAIGSLFSPLGAGIGSAIGSMLDVAFGGDGKQRQNAGFFVGPTPGADPNMMFDVDPFTSGLRVQGFARRADQQVARQVIDTFREVDGTLAAIIAQLNGSLDMSRATLSGLDQQATPGSSGTLFGLGGNGQLAGDLLAQIKSYVDQALDHVQGVSAELLATAKAASTAEEALAILAKGVDDKRIADQVAAETAEKAAAAAESLRQAEQRLLEERIGLTRAMSSELQSIRSLRDAIRMDVNTILGAIPLFEMDASVTQQIAHIEEQRRLLLQNHADQMEAERQLHEQRMNASRSLSELAFQMQFGSQSTLSGEGRLELIQSRFRDTLQAAMSGDVGAAEELQNLAQRYAEESQNMFASNDDHRANMQEILAGLNQASAVMAQSTFDPAAANATLLAALNALDAQLALIGTGVNQSIINELQNIRVVLEELSPEMRNTLTGAISQWIQTTRPEGAAIISALSGIKGSVEALPPEIAGYMSGAMGQWIQSMLKSGSYTQVVADSISRGGLDESAANQYLRDQGLGSVNDYRSAYNPNLDSSQIADHVNQLLASSQSQEEAYRRIYADAAANNVGSKQLADSLGMTQQDVIAAAVQLGLPSFNGGGIASGPPSGHLALLHGTEAVVPLENGAIPVRVSMLAANEPIVREIRGLREENARLVTELESLRSDMRSGMAFAAGQRDTLAEITTQVRDTLRPAGVRNGTIG